MTEEDREVAAVVRRMRRKSGMSQHQFAAAAGMSQSRLSLYESGHKRPKRRSLERLAAAAGEPLERFLEELRFLPALASAGDALEAAEEETQAAPGPEETLTRTALAALRAELAKGMAELGLLDGSVPAGPAPAAEEAAAEVAWSRLASLPAERRRELVASDAQYQTPELCARLCRASLETTSKDLEEALELAQLAVQVAYLLPGDDALRWEAEGHAWAHVGNVRRVANDFKRAAAAFAKSRELRPAAAHASGYFDEGRPLDLEASLRRDQRKFSEALVLHDRAFALSRAEHLPYVLLNKAGTLQQSGRYEDALEVLAQAQKHVDARTPPRLVFGMRFNETTNLCHLDRYGDAAKLLPEVRELSDPANALDLTRTRWLEGRVALGFGEREEAAAAFEEVRNAFAGRRLPYDMALATLDLAALYLEDGRTRDVKTLAKEMVAIFLDQGVHREATAAARLFARAVAAETATVELARRLARYLQWAQHDPALRFEG